MSIQSHHFSAPELYNKLRTSKNYSYSFKVFNTVKIRRDQQVAADFYAKLKVRNAWDKSNTGFHPIRPQ